MYPLLSQIIFEGKIPFLKTLKKIILFLSFIPLVGIFFFPEDFQDLGEMAWGVLITLLMIRPLGDIFIDFKILRGVLPLRKELGILCGSLGISHSIGYFFDSGISLSTGLLDPYLWDPKNYFFWGMIGFIIALLLTLTSNLFSVRLLKRWWKRLHYLVYVFFIVIALHIAIIKAGNEGTYMSTEVVEAFFPLVFMSILWLLSALKVTFSFRK